METTKVEHRPPSEKSIAETTDTRTPEEKVPVEAPVNKDPESATPETKRYPETDLDRGIVGWDGQNDPHNPQNFPSARKWGLLGLMSAITFVSPLASSMFSPSVSYVAADLGVTNETLLSFSISIFLLGYAVSTLARWNTLSNAKARRYALHSSAHSS